MKPRQRRAQEERKRLQSEERLRRAVRKNAHRLLDGFLQGTEPESQMPMIDVLCAHVAVGYGFTVGVSVEHPNAEGRVQEQSKPLIEVAE